uniref:Secreted protein n=1 Tax=Colobus angolensis palliatus TaxID=336983 RepID=A0A2K5JQ11_COLAP
MLLPDGSFCLVLLLKHTSCGPQAFLKCSVLDWTGNQQGACLLWSEVVCRSASPPWCRASQCPSRTPPGWPGSFTARRLPWDNSLVKFTFPLPLSGAPSCVICGPPEVWYVLEQWEAVICCVSSHPAFES